MAVSRSQAEYSARERTVHRCWAHARHAGSSCEQAAAGRAPARIGLVGIDRACYRVVRNTRRCTCAYFLRESAAGDQRNVDLRRELLDRNLLLVDTQRVHDPFDISTRTAGHEDVERSRRDEVRIRRELVAVFAVIGHDGELCRPRSKIEEVPLT